MNPFWPMLAVLVSMWLYIVRWNAQIAKAGRRHQVAFAALSWWIHEHPDVSPAYPHAQELVRESLFAWRAYVEEFPPADDGGVLEGFLENLLV